MARGQSEATLIDVLVDGFEKNESIGGYHWRQLPMPDEAAARAKFEELAAEARRWKGPPPRDEDDGARRVQAWPDLEVRQAGRGILVLVRAPLFDSWWHRRDTWHGHPIGEVFDWWQAELDAARR